ncbi:hypothetical protein [Azospirillum rugosum]|uniref:Uncharacterized protein n=1 Tax=Azospirillum rugosum TaxID=416170 RepID=A0ABS4SHQ0_9PROT|nr:hypothetical protein [Azospirillum rugosum]MBP2291995.1 hypothetical protein [Azospirillum rugosum]MDQ0525869.1 hypothetical protein [Azospirillum rugosum]
MEREDECALDRYITAIPPKLRLVARAAYEELSNNPFLPVFSKDEIARLVCSPGFQSYLESESSLNANSLFLLYSANLSTRH